MGGKGGDSGGQSNEAQAMMAQKQREGQLIQAAMAQKQAAAEKPAEEPAKTEEPKTDDTTKTTTTDTAAGKGNLTGLGDAMVSGLAEGRVQQVADQTGRVGANPQTYSPQYDPYSGTFVGQGPYPTAPAPIAQPKTGTQV